MINFDSRKICDSDIPNFNFEYDFDKYYDDIKDDFEQIKKYFPLLHLTLLATKQGKEIFISGNLIPCEVYDKCNTDEDIERFSLPIIAVYPSDFPENEIYVEDYTKKIDWSKIPYKHRHLNPHPSIKNKTALCTHHPNGEINEIDVEYKSIAILNSAWKLYIQYVEYKKTGKWSLEDLKHGCAGTRQLKRSGKYHDRGKGGV